MLAIDRRQDKRFRMESPERIRWKALGKMMEVAAFVTRSAALRRRAEVLQHRSHIDISRWIGGLLRGRIGKAR